MSHTVQKSKHSFSWLCFLYPSRPSHRHHRYTQQEVYTLSVLLGWHSAACNQRPNIITIKTLGSVYPKQQKDIGRYSVAGMMAITDAVGSPSSTFLLCHLTITGWQLHLQASHQCFRKERERRVREKHMPSETPPLYQGKILFPGSSPK